MNAQHTPGPWETSVFTARKENQVTHEWDVCVANGGDMLADLAGCDNAEANARLIAAAPDLLAALRGLLPLAERGVDILKQKSCGDLYPQLWEGDLERARAVIAKAEGTK